MSAVRKKLENEQREDSKTDISLEDYVDNYYEGITVKDLVNPEKLFREEILFISQGSIEEKFSNGNNLGFNEELLYSEINSNIYSDVHTIFASYPEETKSTDKMTIVRVDSEITEEEIEVVRKKVIPRKKVVKNKI